MMINGFKVKHYHHGWKPYWIIRYHIPMSTEYMEYGVADETVGGVPEPDMDKYIEIYARLEKETDMKEFKKKSVECVINRIGDLPEEAHFNDKEFPLTV
jgi:hypothetical protein